MLRWTCRTGLKSIQTLRGLHKLSATAKCPTENAAKYCTSSTPPPSTPPCISFTQAAPQSWILTHVQSLSYEWETLQIMEVIVIEIVGVHFRKPPSRLLVDRLWHLEEYMCRIFELLSSLNPVFGLFKKKKKVIWISKEQMCNCTR